MQPLIMYVCSFSDCGRMFARPQSTDNPHTPVPCPHDNEDMYPATIGYDHDREATTITILHPPPEVVSQDDTVTAPASKAKPRGRTQK